ncbi:MAG TPA: alpha-hydroxy-acid oxidizing protein, partial [Nocardioides sp.]|nr:alpha-hydroxy-acid oxidizing protein [Nocardioides sp.]
MKFRQRVAVNMEGRSTAVTLVGQQAFMPVAIAPVGSGRSDANVSEAVAESFAKAGHRVVLVRADRSPSGGGIGVDDKGLAQALMYERLNVVDLLQPSVEPLLSLLND